MSTAKNSKMFFVAIIFVAFLMLTACEPPKGSGDVLTVDTFTATSFKEDAQRYVDGANDTVNMITSTTVDGCGAFNPCN